MDEQKLGIQETKDAVIAVAKFYKLGKEVGADSKVDFKDIPAVIQAGPGVFTSTMKAIEGGKKIPAELKDFSSEEAAELASAVQIEFGFADSEKAMRIIAKSLKLIAAGVELASEF